MPFEDNLSDPGEGRGRGEGEGASDGNGVEGVRWRRGRGAAERGAAEGG